MGKLFLLFALTIAVLAEDDFASRKPVYKYRYETEDVMKTAASTVPIRGYHVVEGGYYPSEIGLGGGGGGGGGVGIGGIGGGYGGGIGGGYGGGIGGIGGGGGYGGRFIGGGYGGGSGIGLGGAGLSQIGYGGGQFIGGGGGGGQFIGGGGGQLLGGGGQFIGSGGGQLIGGGGGQFIGGGGGGGQFIGGGGGLHGGYGGEYIDKNVYSGGKKNLNDESFEKSSGKKGEEVNQGKEGYTQGVAAVKNNKGESGYENDQSAGKKVVEDGKQYYGGQHFDKAGKQGGEENEKKGHKKGHVIKGFKSSHHKDESGKTEEFYDEANDEAGNTNFKGESGSFGEKGASSFKGGHENGEFASGGHKKQAHFDNEHLVDNSNANKGKYGENKYAGNGAVYGVNNGIDQQSLLGHQENSRFYKHHPHHVPFY